MGESKHKRDSAGTTDIAHLMEASNKLGAHNQVECKSWFEVQKESEKGKGNNSLRQQCLKIDLSSEASVEL